MTQDRHIATVLPGRCTKGVSGRSVSIAILLTATTATTTTTTPVGVR